MPPTPPANIAGIASEATYRGRFAPSPTGPLHFGSLVSALGSWLRARSRNGSWVIRTEDIDPPRERDGAAEAIIATLAAFGMHSDQPILRQRDRHPLYRAELQRLIDSGDAFLCACTRSDLAPSGIHIGACKRSAKTGAWRMRVPAAQWSFDDLLMGPFVQRTDAVGDFVLWRADGLPAYQLAVVVDDHAQGISEVVRGADLLDSTPRQIYLQQRLGYSTPRYLHLPLVLDANGNKLGKSIASLPLENEAPLPALRAALGFLGLAVPAAVDDVDRMLQTAVAAFEVANIPPTSRLP